MRSTGTNSPQTIRAPISCEWDPGCLACVKCSAIHRIAGSLRGGKECWHVKSKGTWHNGCTSLYTRWCCLVLHTACFLNDFYRHTCWKKFPRTTTTNLAIHAFITSRILKMEKSCQVSANAPSLATSTNMRHIADPIFFNVDPKESVTNWNNRCICNDCGPPQYNNFSKQCK